eukprot:m.88110 g.88110  ORF g.88110 m.88110 type:complete len:70 (-) comp13143_c0_seq2:13-222(-)
MIVQPLFQLPMAEMLEYLRGQQKLPPPLACPLGQPVLSPSCTVRRKEATIASTHPSPLISHNHNSSYSQ